MNLTSKQEFKLRNIIYKGDNWDNDYDNLFLELIPITYRIIINNNKYSNNLLMENDDFLSWAFEMYVKTIDKIKIDKNLISDFLRIYHANLRDKIRSTWKKHNKNGQRILNYYYEYENAKESDYQPINYFYSTEMYNVLLKDFFMLRFIDLKLQGKDVDSIIKDMNMSKSSFYKKLNESRQRIISSI